jgi:hypothetical protein
MKQYLDTIKLKEILSRKYIISFLAPLFVLLALHVVISYFSFRTLIHLNFCKFDIWINIVTYLK